MNFRCARKYSDTSDTENTIRFLLFVYLHPNSFEMAKKFTYKTQGTCSKSIEIELEGDIVKSVRFEGGCHGNTQGIGLLTRGMQAGRRDRTSRRHRLQRPGNILSRPAGKGVASGPRPITAAAKPENGPVLQNPGKHSSKNEMMFYYEEMGRISYFICRILYYKCLLYKGKQHVPLVRDGNEQNRVCGVLGICMDPKLGSGSPCSWRYL